MTVIKPIGMALSLSAVMGDPDGGRRPVRAQTAAPAETNAPPFP
jgi:hypothetical protein